MWITMDENYRRQKEKYRLQECCEDCQHFCEVRKSCEMAYPVNPHLRATFDEAQEGERIHFCKMFEAA
jgi:hypothetical protein